MPFKQCGSSYRTIDGVRFKQETDDTSEFLSVINECKEKGLKYRIDNNNGRIWIEVK